WNANGLLPRAHAGDIVPVRPHRAALVAKPARQQVDIGTEGLEAIAAPRKWLVQITLDEFIELRLIGKQRVNLHGNIRKVKRAGDSLSGCALRGVVRDRITHEMIGAVLCFVERPWFEVVVAAVAVGGVPVTGLLRLGRPARSMFFA